MMAFNKLWKMSKDGLDFSAEDGWLNKEEKRFIAVSLHKLGGPSPLKQLLQLSLKAAQCFKLDMTPHRLQLHV
jgi:hypothetical protein